MDLGDDDDAVDDNAVDFGIVIFVLHRVSRRGTLAASPTPATWPQSLGESTPPNIRPHRWRIPHRSRPGAFADSCRSVKHVNVWPQQRRVCGRLTILFFH